MTTPEARTKNKLRLLLSRYDGLYAFWPVPMGYGATTLDVLGCYRGRFFSVESKADGKKPTLRQQVVIEQIEYAMGKTFVIIGVHSPVFDELAQWLDQLSESPNDPHIPQDRVDRRTI